MALLLSKTKLLPQANLSGEQLTHNVAQQIIKKRITLKQLWSLLEVLSFRLPTSKRRRKKCRKMIRFKRLFMMSLLLAFILFLTFSFTRPKENIEFPQDDFDDVNIGDDLLPDENAIAAEEDLVAEEDNRLESAVMLNSDVEDYDIKLKVLMDQVESENSCRLDRISNICQKYRLGLYKISDNPSPIKHPPTPQYSVFYFDRSNHLALCPIYKAGSSTWLYNMLLLGGMKEDEIDNSNKQLSDMARALYPVLDPTMAEMEFQTSFKILTVRHPFERLLSAYRDKLENINFGAEHGTIHYYQSFGSKIVKKYRPYGNKTLATDLLQPDQYLWNPNHPKPAGVEPTFREFVRYLTETDVVSKADDHWIPYYLFCTPCLLQYNFIAKVETLDQDQQYVIRSSGLSDKIKPKWRHKTQFIGSNHDGNSVSAVAQVYFKQLTSALILKLFQTYQVDFELFGYDFQPYVKYAKDAPKLT